MTFEQLRELFLWLGAGLGTVTAVFTAVNAFRGAKPKMMVDDSTAAGNFQKIIVEMQADDQRQQKHIDAQQRQIEALRIAMESSTLNITMRIAVGNAPVIEGFSWVPSIHVEDARIETVTEKSPPRKDGLGMRR